MMKQHTLTNMRDHLLALAGGDPAQAGRIAEQRLGMSSLQAHGAHESSRHMPQKMQEIGTVMHRSASRFAIKAENATASGDLRLALATLAHTIQACVACHARYRLQ